MKKIFAFVAATILMLSVASCGNRAAQGDADAQVDSTEVVAADSAAVETVAADTVAVVAE